MRYPPLGTRSFGPTRVIFAAGVGYADEANDEILAIGMIETREGVENIQEIVTTPGLDAIYIGPADLTLGAKQGELPPGLDREEPEMVELIQSILKTAKGAGIHACLHCATPEYAAKAIGWGFDLTTISGDSRLLATSAAATVGKARALIGDTAKPGEHKG